MAIYIVQKHGVYLLVGPAQNVCIARCMLDHSKDPLNARRLSMWMMLVHPCSEACAINDGIKNNIIPKIRCQSHPALLSMMIPTA